MNEKILQSLFECGLYTSAEYLGCFNISDDSSPSSLVLFGQSLYELGEYRRALKYFNMAVEILKVEEENPAMVKKDQEKKKEYEIKQLCFDCLVKLKEDKMALKILRDVPPSQLTPKCAMLFARLLSQFEGKRKATPYYKRVLVDAPFAIEAIMGLIDGGLNGMELRETCKIQVAEVKWLGKLFEAHQYIVRNSFSKAKELFESLLVQFPKNIHILKNLALCNYQNGNGDTAMDYFKQIRKLDPTFVEAMDVYALLIKGQGQISELNRLAHDLLQANPYRAETWTVIAMYYDAKGKKEKAVYHVEKAIDIDQYHVMAHQYKGSLSISLKQYDMAILALRTAKTLQKNLPIFKGLVTAYLALQDQQGALTIACEAQKILGSLEPALCLPALVFAQSRDTEHQDKAKEIFLAVLKRDPSCLDAVTGLCTLYKAQDNYDEAIKLLKNYLEKYNVDFLHTTMGDILAATEKYDEAIIHYGNALKINQLCETAIHGIEAAESRLRGGDPAEHDEEEGNNFDEEFEA